MCGWRGLGGDGCVVEGAKYFYEGTQGPVVGSFCGYSEAPESPNRVYMFTLAINDTKSSW